MERIKISLMDTLKMVLLCIAAYPAGLILMLLLGGNADLAISLPIISGFIHQSLSHFFFNILLLFLLLIYKGNSYNIKQMVAILVVIQTLCFILTFFGVLTSIGISGLVYFLMTRFLIGYKKIFIPLLVIIFIGELVTLNDPDGISHWGHLIGIVLGFISLGYFNSLIQKHHYQNHRLIQLVCNIFVPQR